MYTDDAYSELFMFSNYFLEFLIAGLKKKKQKTTTILKRIQLKPPLKNITKALKQISLESSYLHTIILLIGALLDTYSSAL